MESNLPKSKAKIAIIEDDLATSQMYRHKFELEGFQVECAGEGQTAIKLIEDFKPDIVLLDVMLPNMDGVSILSAIRSRPKMANLKIIVLTNLENPDVTKKALDQGALDYIIKTEMTPRQVLERIKQLL